MLHRWTKVLFVTPLPVDRMSSVWLECTLLLLSRWAAIEIEGPPPRSPILSPPGQWHGGYSATHHCPRRICCFKFNKAPLWNIWSRRPFSYSLRWENTLAICCLWKAQCPSPSNPPIERVKSLHLFNETSWRMMNSVNQFCSSFSFFKYCSITYIKKTSHGCSIFPEELLSEFLFCWLKHCHRNSYIHML